MGDTRSGKRTDLVFSERRPRRARKKIVRRPGHLDYVVLILVVFLVCFGLIMIYSTSSYKGGMLFNDPAYWLKRQAFFGFVGLIFMIVVARLDYHIWNSINLWFYLLYFGSIALLGITLIFAAVTNGSKRWLNLGPVSFQPSEAIKVALILILAIFISDHVRALQNTWRILIVFGMMLPIIIPVAMENLSTGTIYVMITLIMLYVVARDFKPFLILIIVGVTGFLTLLIAKPYRVNRIYLWFHPGEGMQTMQGIYAIGSGGLFGKGLGQSMQKMGFLPETHNDMIFSIVCEELGLFGAICIIILYLLLLWRFLRIAMKADDLYGSLIVIGAIAHIGFQVFVNIGVVTNVLPNTGVPLPFISYGGTSMLFLLIEMGLVLSVSRYIRDGR